MKIIKFDKDYNNKSNLDIFTTIRDDQKGNVGEIVLCKFPDKEFKAEIIDCFREDLFEPLDDISKGILLIDTGENNIEKAINLISKFYPNTFRFYFHILEKVKE